MHAPDRLTILIALTGLLVSACAGTSRGPTSARPFEARTAWTAGDDDGPRFDAGDLPATSRGVPLRGEAVEGEWRTYRGNVERTGTRIAPVIETPQIAWRARVGIQGYTNTPLIGDGTVYVTSQGDTHNAPDNEDGLYAFDADDGTPRWFTATPADLNGGTLTDDYVLAGSDDGTLYAFDRETGAIAWETTLANPQSHGPLVLGQVAYIAGEEHVDLVDVSSGLSLGRWPGVWNSWDARGGLASDGERVFMSGRNGMLGAIEDGELVWTAGVASPLGEEWADLATYGPPMVAGSAIVGSALDRLYDGNTYTYMAAVDGESGQRLWLTETGLPVEPPLGTGRRFESYDHYYAAVPWLMGGVLWAPHLGADVLAGYDLSQGDMARAITLADCRSRQFASIVGVSGVGYYPRHDGRLYAFDATTGSTIWGIALQYEADAGQAVTDGWSHYGDGMYCYSDPFDGTALFATPAIDDDGTIFVGSGEGWLYAIRDAHW